MPLYTIESPNTIPRLTNARIMADTSYMMALADENDQFHSIVEPFHAAVHSQGANFSINFVVRQELMRLGRRRQLIAAIIELGSMDPVYDVRYRNVMRVKQRGKALKDCPIPQFCESIYKTHVRQDDVHRLTALIAMDIWEEVQRFEGLANANYVRGDGKVSWDEAGNLIETGCLPPNDAMIANFALAFKHSAIVTTDCDYVRVSSLIDVYMPRSVAIPCSLYDPAIDMP